MGERFVPPKQFPSLGLWAERQNVWVRFLVAVSLTTSPFWITVLVGFFR